MKNKLTDLNNHLFAQIERLSDEKLSGDQLENEIKRGQAVTNVAKQIIENGKLALSAQKAVDEGLIIGSPAMLGIEHKVGLNGRRQ